VDHLADYLAAIRPISRLYQIIDDLEVDAVDEDPNLSLLINHPEAPSLMARKRWLGHKARLAAALSQRELSPPKPSPCFSTSTCLPFTIQLQSSYMAVSI
jgi:hypothetical protein